MNKLGVKLAWIWMVSFAAAGIMGFVPNPLVGPNGLFETNIAHNFVHLITAIALIGVAIAGERASTRFMLAFGPIYMLVGILGFVTLQGASQGSLLGIIHINSWDNYLHVGLGIGIGLSGLAALGWSTVPQARPQEG